MASVWIVAFIFVVACQYGKPLERSIFGGKTGFKFLSWSDIGNCSKPSKHHHHSTPAPPTPGGEEARRAPQEGDLCEPSDERWYPVADDQSAFLFCEVARK